MEHPLRRAGGSSMRDNVISQEEHRSKKSRGDEERNKEARG